MTNSSVIPVVCAIIERENKILAAQRGETQTNAGLWEFPGGKVNAGETPELALKREIHEELAIKITIHKKLNPVLYQYPWISIELIPFVCSIKEGEPDALEHVQIRFFTKKTCLDLNWAPADVNVLKEYLHIKI